MITYKLPNWCVTPIVNDDRTGLSNDESAQLSIFLESLPECAYLVYLDEYGFSWSNDLDNLGCDCSTFALMTTNL